MMRALVCVLGLVSGCSFLTVRGVPDNITTHRPVPCTESLIAPILDTVPAVGFFGGGTRLIVEAFRERGGGQDSPAAILFVTGVLGVLASVPFVASAAHGYVKTGRCREVNRSLLSPPPPAGAATSP
jgi:hypothetical protein